MPGKPLAVTNARIIDGFGGPPIEAGTVLVEDGRISALGAGIPVPEAADAIDAGGRTLIPGLVDMHVHVLPYGDAALACYLACGVTSVRDVGGEADAVLSLRARAAAGNLLSPRIYSYGPLLDWNPPAIALNTTLGFIGRPHDSIEELARSVEELVTNGIDGIKLYAGLKPPAVQAAIAQVAGRVPVTGHLGRTWASEAIDAGINCFEHLFLTLYQDIARPEDRHDRDGELYGPWRFEGWARADLDAPYVEQLIASMVANDVALSPTTILMTGGLDPRPGTDMGEKYQQAFVRERERLATERLGQPPTVMTGRAPTDPAIAAAALEKELRFLEKLHRAGGTIVPSTDTAAVPTTPGFSLHREMLLLSEAGMTNSEVIQAATEGAARVLRRDDEIGGLRPGKIADFVLLDADPLADIRAVAKVHTVVKDGRVFAPADLFAATGA